MAIDAASSIPVTPRTSIAHVNKMLLDITAKAMEEDDKKVAYDVTNLANGAQNVPRATKDSGMLINMLA